MEAGRPAPHTPARAHAHHGAHGHAHGHAHDHAHAPAEYGRAFALGIALNTAFVVVEAVFGVLSNSVALLADAGHNLSDVLTLAIAWVGSSLAKRAPSGRFTYGFRSTSILAALFNAVVAWRMWTGGTPKGERGLPGPAALVGVGAGIGFICALVGAGGAFLSVPFMTRCSVPMREAVGTSAALGFPIALASTVGYIAGGWSLPQALPGAFGYLYLPGILIVALASVLMAPIGARTAHRMPVVKLRRAFGLLLGLLAAYMAWQAIKG